MYAIERFSFGNSNSIFKTARAEDVGKSDTDERYGRDHTQAQELSIITCVKSTVFVWNLCEWLFPRWRYEFLFRWQAACSRR